MMFYMHSKTFQKVYVPNESRKHILKAQYVLVSSRIRRRSNKVKNIISAASCLFPDNNTCNAMCDDDIREAYFEQLDDNKPLIATLVLGSIEEGYNVIFMCTPTEMKLKYLKYLSEYIYMEFGYPIYEYKAYATGKCDIRKYNKDKCVKTCKNILKKAKKTQYEKNLKSKQGREKIVEGFKKLKKKELIRELEKRNLYNPNMSKSDMIEMLELFL